MERPDCVCFKEVGSVGDRVVDTVGRTLVQFAMEAAEESQICPAAAPYVFSTWAAGILIAHAFRNKLQAGGSIQDPDTSDLERDALALIPELENIIRGRLAIIQSKGKTAQ